MPIRTYSPIYAVLANPLSGDHLVYDGTKWVNSVGGAVTETLAQTLASGNVTGGNNISITSGDSIVYNNGAFTASIVEPTLASNIVLTLPSSTGTFALLSDVQASDTLSEILAIGNTTGANNISINTGQSIIYNNSTFTATISESTLSGNIVLTLPVSTGTFALTSDIPAPDGNGIYDGSGSLTSTTDITIPLAYKLTFTSDSTKSGIFSLQRPLNTVGTLAGQNYKMYDSTNAFTSYAKIRAEVVTNTSGATDGNLQFHTAQSGSLSQKMVIRYDGKVGIGFSVPSAITSKFEIFGDGSTSATISARVNNSGGVSMFHVRDDGVVVIGNPSTTAERLHIKGAATSGSIIRNIFEGVNVSKTDVTDVYIDAGTGNGNSNYKALHIKGNVTGVNSNDVLFIELNQYGSSSSATGSIVRFKAGNVNGANYDALTLNYRGGVVIGETPNTTANILQSSITTKRFTVIHNDTNVGSTGNLSHWGAYIESSVTKSAINTGTSNFIRYGLEIVSTGTWVDTDSFDGKSVGLKITTSGADLNYALVTAGGSIGFGTETPNASAMLEIVSTTQGVLFPRMTATQGSAITGVNGLVIYVTSTDATFTSVGFWGYQAGAWAKL